MTMKKQAIAGHLRQSNMQSDPRVSSWSGRALHDGLVVTAGRCSVTPDDCQITTETDGPASCYARSAQQSLGNAGVNRWCIQDALISPVY